jgi:hypothetical protein
MKKKYKDKINTKEMGNILRLSGKRKEGRIRGGEQDRKDEKDMPLL